MMNEAPAKNYVGLSGAQMLHEILVEEGVDLLFGIPGGMVLPIFDVLYSSPIRFILTRHEQGAIHMADGYARTTGRVGCVLATSGPGATNLVTGLAAANMDSVPLVAITGQVRSTLIGNDAFQEVDIVGISRQVTKYNVLVKRIEDLGRCLREAFHVARTGRPGAVLVDIPIDVSLGKLTANPDLALDLPGYRPRPTGNMRQIQAAAGLINESQRPLLYVGGGAIISGACEQVRALMHKGRIPVTTTLMAMGAVDETDPLALQMLGMHGTATANYAVQDCDCLVAIGARFDDRVTGKVETFAPKAKIIHIDIDPTSIGKNIEPRIPVVGDARDVLEKMLPLIQEKVREPWLAQLASWKAKHPLTYGRGARIKPQAVMAAVGKLTDHDAFISTGVGQHQMWAAQFCGWKRPRQFITSGGQGTMGFGLPAAIGAQFGNPGKLVIDIDGDGSFAMTMAEMITAVHYQQPVKVIIIDNDYLGMPRQWQELIYGRRYSSVEHWCPDMKAVAQAMGAKGLQITAPGEVEDGIRELIRTEGPAVLVAKVEPEENVFPMVAPGKSLHEMDLGTA